MAMCPPGQSSYTRHSRLRRAHSPAAPTGVSSARRVCPPHPPPPPHRSHAPVRAVRPTLGGRAGGPVGWPRSPQRDRRGTCRAEPPLPPSAAVAVPLPRRRRRCQLGAWPRWLAILSVPPPPLNGSEGKARRSSGVAGKPEALSCTATSASLGRAGGTGVEGTRAHYGCILRRAMESGGWSQIASRRRWASPV